jgi:uncharacterized protein (TIGR03118 family)
MVRKNSTLRHVVRGVAAVAITSVALFVAAPAHAVAANQFTEVDLVSDQAGHAPLVDPLLKNAWGLALGPTSPLWVANEGTKTATIYAGGVNGGPVTKAPLTVSIPTSEGPTGQAFNNTGQFVVIGPGGSGPAVFLFVTLSGDVVGWNPTANRTTAIVAVHTPDAIYTGLALVQTAAGPFLLAADFHHARIDVFDGHFQRVTLPAGGFQDPNLPSGYAPFNVTVAGGSVYVAYAKQDEDAEEEVAGRGLGFVDRYDLLGSLVQQIAEHGTLNAPWGLAIAPASFGRFAGALLVGNFGDGRIGAYGDGKFLGLLRGPHGPLAIDGLWALLPGTATTGGTGVVWFSAGPDDEEHGLVGQIIPITE